MFAIEPIDVVAVGIISAGIVIAYAKHAANKLHQRKQELEITR